MAKGNRLPTELTVDHSTKPGFNMSRGERAALKKMEAETQQAEAAEASASDSANAKPDEAPQDGEQPAEQPEVKRSVRKLTASDLAGWRTARRRAVVALETATPGSVFLVGVEPADERPLVIVGTANPDLTSRQRQHLTAAVTHLGLFHAQAPAE